MPWILAHANTQYKRHSSECGAQMLRFYFYEIVSSLLSRQINHYLEESCSEYKLVLSTRSGDLAVKITIDVMILDRAQF